VKREIVEIRPFQPADQTATKQLILDGLAEHWGILDTTLNQDLNNIASSYQGETFFVAVLGEEIIGCGALIVEDKAERTYGRIVRMSVKKVYQKQGIGTRILQHLEIAAKQKQIQKIILETTQTWDKVIAFYQANGFHIVGHWNEDTHFEKDLNPTS
jgi:N-acetylglutamate synthase-like GNAT family acetyltransferase